MTEQATTSNLDFAYIYHALADKTLLLEPKIKIKFLNDDARELLQFVYDHFEKHGEIPSNETIKHSFGIEIPKTDLDLGYVVDEIKNRALHSTVRRSMEYYIQQLNLKNYKNILEHKDKFSLAIDRLSIEDTQLTDAMDAKLNESLVEDYMARKRGEYGVITPWPSMNDLTLGWQPGDFALFGARSGLGKTWYSLRMAHHCWRKLGIKVMYHSPEMIRNNLVKRLAAIDLGISYDRIRKGKLNEVSEQQYLKFLKNHEKNNSKQMQIFSDHFKVYIEDLEPLIHREKPDILFLDSVYLLKTRKERDRFKAAPIIADEIKVLANKYKLPIICTTQLNREAIKLKLDEMTDNNFVLSDAYIWNCISGDSFVQFKDGLKKVKDVIDGRITNVNVFNGRFYDDALLIKSNKKTVYRIIFEDGRFLDCSADHKIKVFDKKDGFIFKKTKDLNNKDIGLINGFGFKGKKILIKTKATKNNPRFQKIKIPKYVNNDLFFIMGLIVGDGCISEYKHRSMVNIAICPEDNDLLDFVQSIIKKLNLNPTVRRYNKFKKITCDQVNINSIDFVSLLKELGLCKKLSRFKEIPSSVMVSEEKNRIYFLRGLFEADGSITKNGCITYNTMSGQLAIQIKLVLESLGIGSVIRKGGMNSPYGNGYKIRLSVNDSRNFCDKIGFFSKRKKQMILDRIKERREMMIKSNDFFKDQFNLIRVSRVKKLDYKEDMYDIVMKSNIHQFVCNGIIVHNCDWAFILGRDSKDRELNRMTIKPVKTRDGEFSSNIVLNWDFMNNNFTEYSEHQEVVTSESEEEVDMIPF